MTKQYIPQSILIDKYITSKKSLQEIALEHNVSVSVIRRQFKYYDIKIRPMTKMQNIEWRNKISASVKLRYQNDKSYRARISQTRKLLFKNDPSYSKRLSDAIKLLFKTNTEYRNKLKHVNKGRIQPQEEKDKRANTLKTIYKNNPSLVRRMTRGLTSKENQKNVAKILIPIRQRLTYKLKQHDSHIGDKSYLWKGGVSYRKHPSEFNSILREIIRERDGYLCQLCHAEQNGRKHAVHHIDYDKCNNIYSNLITLCIICHTKVHTRNMEFYWTNYFDFLLQPIVPLEV